MNAPLISPAPSLSTDTAEALVERVAQLGESGAPLVAGLRAAADESDSLRLAMALRRVAAEVERGRALDEVVAGAARRLPPHLAGLIRAAQRTGRLGQVLAEWIENRRVARQHWRSVVSALTYPALTVALAILIYIVFATFVVQPLRMIVEDLHLRLPVNLNVLFWISTTGLVFFLVACLTLAAMLVGLRLIGGRSVWSLMITHLPLIGSTWHWTGVAEMLRSLSLLVEHQIPLPEALRLTGGGIGDAYVGGLCRDLAVRVEGGTPLFLAIIQQRSLPLSIVPLVRWGQQSGAVADGLRSAAEMLEGRLRMQSLLLVQIVPPLIFLVVGVMILSLVGAIGATLLTLIQGLS
jgi:type II secretory pathway component PulF